MKSNMLSWAENEVRLASNDNQDGNYWIACAESALRVYKKLLKDRHSGMSIRITKELLNRLIDGLPLTPIEDTDDVWNLIEFEKESGKKTYQCKRMGSLFKYVKSDGTVDYSDVERLYSKDADTGATFYSGFTNSLLDKMYPITFPYYPSSKKYVFTERELLTDRANGDFDTKAIVSLNTPDGKFIEIHRYFGEKDGEWVELTAEEYFERLELDEARKKRESNGKD